ncbi:hypothetical protein NDU88_009273 [Pleurodeles waltl]|uniref:exodeoxyribonuclease III n=1 Tax=Pleurodeles waltl TaxID=8319 RepID=A0AAV7RX44_PLEWA|nr:hypothetical protein NDU88_009273 [Pleurodeles waltl]
MEEEQQSLPAKLEEEEPETSQVGKQASEKHQAMVAKTTALRRRPAKSLTSSMAISLFSINVRSIRDKRRCASTFNFLASQECDVYMIQECSIPFAASYTHLEQQWTFGPSFWSGGNSSRSVGVATLVRGRCFTVDSVTELEGGRALVIDGSWAGELVRLINVYAPSDVGERRELFQRLRPQLVTSRTIMMGGDFNCILESGGRCGTRAGEGWMDDAAKLLAEMVGEASLTDVIGSMGPDARNFTWSRPDGSVRSRIDFVFTSKSVRIRQHSMVTVHFSDHRAIRFRGK